MVKEYKNPHCPQDGTLCAPSNDGTCGDCNDDQGTLSPRLCLLSLGGDSIIFRFDRHGDLIVVINHQQNFILYDKEWMELRDWLNRS